MKLLTDNVLSNLEATFSVLKTSGNESWENQFPVKVWFWGFSVWSVWSVWSIWHTWVYPSMGLPKYGYTQVWVYPSMGIPKYGYTQAWGYPSMGIPKYGYTQAWGYPSMGIPKRGVTQVWVYPSMGIPKHKSLWRRSPAGSFFFKKKHVPFQKTHVYCCFW